MTLTESVLVMAERYGNGALPPDRADQFVKEQSTHGSLLDPRVDLDAVFDTVPDEWHELLAPGESRIEEHLAAQAA